VADYFSAKLLKMIYESKILELIDRQKATGLNITAFCANEGIPKSSYYYWRKKLNRGPSNRFIPLLINSTAATMSGPSKDSIRKQHEHHSSCDAYPMEITYPNGTTLRIKHALDLAGLRSLVLLVD
jgi:ssDNA-binding Zn-finger/Zn-ribbon topoisomerase 1